MNRKIRILQTINLPWDEKLGASKIQIELSEEYIKSDFIVEHFCLDEANIGTSVIYPLLFSKKVINYLQNHKGVYDIIEANQSDFPCSKKRFGFEGLLVFRSFGLLFNYNEIINKYSLKKNMHKGLFYVLSQIKRSVLQYLFSDSIRKCINYADLLIVNNSDEYLYIKKHFPHKSVYFLPLAISNKKKNLLLKNIPDISSKKIVFIGYWQPRKGSVDWPEIVKRVVEHSPEVKFKFIGTGKSDAEVLNAIGSRYKNQIENVSCYSPEDLPSLLNDCSVGAFPSYVEGFGYATLEKITAGLPTVGYFSPGTKDILSKVNYPLLVSPGCKKEFADKLIEILSMNEAEYSSLSAECRRVAKTYSLGGIAKKTLKIYMRAFSSLDRTNE